MSKADRWTVSSGYDVLHEYGRVVVDVALRRGLAVEISDPERGELVLTLGSRSIRTRESLSELTSGVALDRCQDKLAARRKLASAGCKVPRARVATGDAGDVAFLREVGAVVVKPVRGAEGRAVFPNIRTQKQLAAVTGELGTTGEAVILEEMCAGVEVRVIVIGFEPAAAIVRTHPTVIADGARTVRELIAAKNQDLRASLGERAGIPRDGATAAALASGGFRLDSVPCAGTVITARHPTSLSADRLAGGTVQDVTELLHPAIREGARAASLALDMPVLGLDMIVSSPAEPAHVIIDANERPGLSNYDPQPVVDRFLELLFPELARSQ